MLGRKIKVLSVLALPLIAAGCVSTDYAAKDAGFLNVSLKSGEATGKQTVWVQNQQHAQVVRDRVKTLMPELVELVMARPLISAGMVAKTLEVTPQGARRIVQELGLREMTGRGRFRAWGIL